jgi:NAD(P)-dependent dehydrogenase (short-subunit alcohol dehydrogenase family)
MTTIARMLVKGAFVGGLFVVGAQRYLRRRAARNKFEGKVVFITGGSRGLGLALAEEFLRSGARVAISGRDEEALAKAHSQLQLTRPADGAARHVICDVTDPASVSAAVKTIQDDLGPIDVLVNDAGIMSVAPVQNQSLTRFHEAMDTNFFGAVNSSLAVLPVMLERGHGAIINIASIGGLISVPHMLPYTASKFALVGFSRGLHVEVKSKGVNVLTVCPWLMSTGSHLHAKMGGKHDLEYGWFATGATLPLLSVPARVAACQIVQAAAREKSELLISRWAVITAKVAANAPALASAVLSMANRFLPAERIAAGDSQIEGRYVQTPSSVPPNTLGRSAELRWNQ